MKKALTPKQTELLRRTYWIMREAQEAFGNALDDIAKENGCKIDVEKWTLSPDMRSFLKVGPK